MPRRRRSPGKWAARGRRPRGVGLAVVGLVAAGLAPGLLAPSAAASYDVHSRTPSPTDPTGTADPVPEETGETGEATPLTLTLRTLSPAVVPVRGPVLMTGTVENGTQEEWEDVNVAPFIGGTPLTTRDELDAAARTPEATEVGARLSEPGTFASVGDLGPGAQADFAVSVPRAALPPESAPGVYWIGVHALGTSVEGRDSVADARARTFVTLPPRGAAAAALPRATPVPLSLVVPLREDAVRDSDGSLADLDRWVDTVGDDGRLDRVSRLAESAGDRPLGWVLDPAVLDALDDLGRGDPPLSLGPPEVADPQQPDPSPSPSDGASASPSASPGGSDAEPEDSAPGSGTDQPASDAPGAADARAVAERVGQRLAGDQVLVTPYADTDTTSLLRRAPELLEQAVALSAQAMLDRGLSGAPVLAAPAGRADPALVGRLPAATTLLLSDGGDLDDPVAGTLDGRPVLLGDARASAGGPGPTPALDALALRQRLLAETSLERQRAASTGAAAPRPVVVVLPADWDPGADWSSADLFGTLDVPWVRWSAPPTSTEPVDPGLTYSEVGRRRELGAANVEAARGVLGVSGALDELLTNDNQALDRLTGAALQTVSYAARARREEAVDAADALTRTVQRALDRVGVFGSEFVTLSGGSGTLTVTVVNDLPQPVEVAVDVRADAGVRVERIDPVALGPEQRVTVRVPVVSEAGVHDVTLVPVTTSGVPAGSTFDFVLRTSQVGLAVWVVMGAAALLFAVTLLRRLRQRRREGGRVRTRATRLQEDRLQEERG